MGIGEKNHELQQEISKVIARRDTLIAEKKTLVARVGRRDATIQKLKDSVALKDADLLTAQSTLTANQENLNAANAEVARLTGEIDSLKQVHVADLAAQQRTIISLQENLSAQLAKNAAQETEIKSLKEVNADIGDRNTLRVMRAAAAEASSLPAITIQRLADWGSEPIFSEKCRLGHPLVPFSPDELQELAEEDALLGKSPWQPPTARTPNVIALWDSLLEHKHKILDDAKDAALQALQEDEATL